MKNTMKKVAIIGLGGQSRSELIPALIKLSDKCQIVALCDTNATLLKESISLLPHADSIQIYSNYSEFFLAMNAGKFHLDGVILAVPHFLYSDIITKAITNNIAVFKEKPFALNITEAKKLNDLALKHNVQIYTVTKRQFFQSYIKGLELLKKGLIGIPYMYCAQNYIPNGNLYEGWRSSLKKAGGGVFIDMGYHLLDILIRYFGDVSKTSLFSSNIGNQKYIYEVEDACSILNQHTNGVHGVLQLAALSGPKDESIEIRGTQGRMVVAKTNVKLYDIFENLRETFICETSGVDAVVLAFEQFLRNDKSIWSENLAHNMILMKIIDMAYKGRNTI